MNIPPEVVVRFSRRCIRDRILKATQGQKIKFQDRDLIFLKDKPWKKRQLKRQYNFLTKTLRELEIPYKWIYPEGLIFTWDGKNQKIDNVIKAKKIAHKKVEKLKYQTSSSSETETSSEEEREEVTSGAAVGTRSGKNQKKKIQKKK